MRLSPPSLPPRPHSFFYHPLIYFQPDTSPTKLESVTHACLPCLPRPLLLVFSPSVPPPAAVPKV